MSKLASKRLICLTRGLLSNRLKSLASSWVLAKRLNRSLHVEWPDEDRVLDLNMLFEKTFEKFKFKNKPEHPKSRGSAIFYSKLEAIEIYEPKLLNLVKTTKYREITSNENFEALEDNVYVFLSDFYPNIQACELRAFFDENNFGFILQNELAEFFRVNKIDKNTKSVHMRGMDFPCKELNLLWYNWKIKSLIGKNRFFLATDDISFENFIKTRYANCVTSTLKPTIGENKVRANLRGLFDQLVLCQTDLKIFDPYSTFAHVAILFSNNSVLKNPKVSLLSKIRAFVKHQVNRLVRIFWRLD